MMKKTTKKEEKTSYEKSGKLAESKAKQSNVSDIPQQAPHEELKAIAKQRREKRKKKMFSLRLYVDTIEWWKTTFGEGYTGVMSRFLEEAKNYPDLVKKCL
jgi:uncharacterized protein (DUF4415 family)